MRRFLGKEKQRLQAMSLLAVLASVGQSSKLRRLCHPQAVHLLQMQLILLPKIACRGKEERMISSIT